MSKATAFIAFTLGAGIGSAAAWYFTKKKYEQIAQEEIDSVKEAFSKLYKRENKADEAPVENDISEEDPGRPVSVMEYATKIAQERYETSTDAESMSESPEVMYELPYVIPPESFDEMEGYEAMSYMYYSDRVLTDERDRRVEDLESTVGFSSCDELESHFGEYEDDSIFVRNDRLKHDIEILWDRHRTYADVLAKEPYKAEV